MKPEQTDLVNPSYFVNMSQFTQKIASISYGA